MENQWLIAENEETLIRFNNLTEDFSKEYPIRMGVAIPIAISAETNEEMQRLETFIETLLEETGILVAILTGANFKEFVFYVKKDLDTKKVHEDIKAAFTFYNIQMYVEADLDWSFFRELKLNLEK